MVYEIIEVTRIFVTLNPFESMPPHCVLNGIDWINMKYVDKMGEFDVFAESICDDVKNMGLINVNEGDPGLVDQGHESKRDDILKRNGPHRLRLSD